MAAQHRRGLSATAVSSCFPAQGGSCREQVTQARGLQEPLRPVFCQRVAPAVVPWGPRFFPPPPAFSGASWASSPAHLLAGPALAAPEAPGHTHSSLPSRRPQSVGFQDQAHPTGGPQRAQRRRFPAGRACGWAGRELGAPWRSSPGKRLESAALASEGVQIALSCEEEQQARGCR